MFCSYHGKREYRSGGSTYGHPRRAPPPPPLKTKFQANLPTSNKNTDHDRKSDLFKTKV